MKLVDQGFCSAPVERVARGLVGKLLARDDVLLRITEVEAYAGPEDSASHARFGPTDRNQIMFGPPGRAYVYLCYGIHHMLNVVAEPEGQAAAVLIRSAELIRGAETVLLRRGQLESPALLAGPGKVAQGLGLTRDHDGLVLTRRGSLGLFEDGTSPALLAGARIGIDYATEKDRRRRWRFAAANSRAVTFPKLLSPSRGSR